MKRPKIARYQLWSEVNPEVILEYTTSGHEPDKAKRGWQLSMDTPNYGYFDKWMSKHGHSSMTYSECERAVEELGKL